MTSLALTQLVCNPPETQPTPTDETGRPTESELPLVVVRVGSNMRYPIGHLRYEMMKVSYTTSVRITYSDIPDKNSTMFSLLLQLTLTLLCIMLTSFDVICRIINQYFLCLTFCREQNKKLYNN